MHRRGGACRVSSADGQHAPFQARDLDVVALVAVLLQAAGIVGDEGEAVDGALQAQVPGWGAEGELDGGVRHRGVQALAVVVEGALAQPFLPDAVQVHVRDRQLG